MLFIQPEKRLLRGDLVVFSYLMGAVGEDRIRLFSMVCKGRTYGKGPKLQYRKFQLKITRKSFTTQMVKH